VHGCTNTAIAWTRKSGAFGYFLWGEHQEVTRHEVHGSTNAASAGMRKSGQGETKSLSRQSDYPIYSKAMLK
jgi:hypothetical protein